MDWERVEMEPRFLCDAMLGSLARWLRLFGFDCTFSAELDDSQLARLAEVEQRWLLTRDRELATKGPRTLLVRSTKLDEQLLEVLSRRRLHLEVSLEQARCSVCNGELRAIDSIEAIESVPPHVAQTVETYRQCQDCRRVYWNGSHTSRILDRMERICVGLRLEEPTDHPSPSREPSIGLTRRSEEDVAEPGVVRPGIRSS
jgi:uncharacterized protein with PIN domain